jgi:hypothetical protein
MPAVPNSEAMIKSLIQSQSQLVANMTNTIEYFGSLTTSSAKLTDAFGGLASVIGQVSTVHRALGDVLSSFSSSASGVTESLMRLAKWRPLGLEKLERGFIGSTSALNKSAFSGASALDKLVKGTLPAAGWGPVFRQLGVEAVQLVGGLAKLGVGAARVVDQFGALSLASLAVGSSRRRRPTWRQRFRGA